MAWVTTTSVACLKSGRSVCAWECRASLGLRSAWTKQVSRKRRVPVTTNQERGGRFGVPYR